MEHTSSGKVNVRGFRDWGDDQQAVNTSHLPHSHYKLMYFTLLWSIYSKQHWIWVGKQSSLQCTYMTDSFLGMHHDVHGSWKSVSAVLCDAVSLVRYYSCKYYSRILQCFCTPQLVAAVYLYLPLMVLFFAPFCCCIMGQTSVFTACNSYTMKLASKLCVSVLEKSLPWWWQ